MAEVDPYKKSIIVAQAAEWLAAQTDSQLDDQLVRRLAAVAQSAQGEDLIRYCLSLAGVK
jgi:HD-GYP domain-containing protein (c-di-GMP phosphodiesterase class II)